MVASEICHDRLGTAHETALANSPAKCDGVDSSKRQ